MEEGMEGSAGAPIVTELQEVLAQACAAMQAQEEGRMQDAIQAFFLARSRVRYAAEALLRPLAEAAPGDGDVSVAAAACAVLDETYTRAIERLSCGCRAGTQLSEPEEGSADAEVTQLDGDTRGAAAGQLERRASGRGGCGVAAAAQRCLREVQGGLDELVGLAAIKQELREAVLLPMALPHLFTGIRRPACNIALFGVPGTGKTMLVEKLAAEAGTPLLCLSPSAILSKWAGESEQSVRAAFEAAAAMAPALIFIDEVDALAPTRSSGDDLAARRVLTELLLQMTAAAARAGPPVFVFAATNRLQDCDPALLRRFDRKIEVPPPDAQARAAFFLSTALRPEVAAHLSEDEAALLAAVTDGCTGSDLSALCREAAMAPLREIMQSGALARGLTDVTVRPVSFDDFAAAAEKLSSGGSSGGGLHAAAG